MRIWYTGTDNGDGSIGVRFFYDQESIYMLDEFDPETYRGEGGGSFEMPADAVFASGLSISTLEEVNAEIEEYENWNEKFSPTANLGLLPQTSETEDYWKPTPGIRM